ncbi:hypothetical protein QN219_04945 [Sinorhizobium sp. 7-81]|uniref:hypothetical protein n=1 Tax=Sinorhizobium sp. 8-89 TaxID=3049089 RepID=UPI0024C32FBE|nr:hypothetical protein [Sinorhizobium sp. 8-89]MDK1489403.1 hypothetical protein [Sinorhizobium sp. 8-89]
MPNVDEIALAEKILATNQRAGAKISTELDHCPPRDAEALGGFIRGVDRIERNGWHRSHLHKRENTLPSARMPTALSSSLLVVVSPLERCGLVGRDLETIGAK